MKKRFVTLIIDGFGVGAMADSKESHANTCASIMSANPALALTNLRNLGLFDIFAEHPQLHNDAVYGYSALQHQGADTFMGHQEIMGSIPLPPKQHRLEENIEVICNQLQSSGYDVRYQYVKQFRYLIVNEAVVISDNIDSDLGMAINCIAVLDFITFDELLMIAHIVRRNTTCNRVIAFGGTDVCLKDILQAEEIKKDYYLGHVAVRTKVYEHNYQVCHLGYGVLAKNQVPSILGRHDIPVTLLGKVADIVANPHGKSIPGVSSEWLLKQTIIEYQQMEQGFICTNIQESDLAGHCMDALRYGEICNLCDVYIGKLKELMRDDDVLLICADHGNDPCIGHNHHTREYVPILVYRKHHRGYMGKRETLSDIGATVCDYFQVEPCENGTSFLHLLNL